MNGMVETIVQLINDYNNGKEIKLPELKFGLDIATIVQLGIILAVVFGIPLWIIMFAFLEYNRNKRKKYYQ